MSNKIITGVKSAVNKAGFAVKKHSPEILVITGIVGMVGAAVVACRATTKAAKVAEEHKKKLESIELAKETRTEAEYTEEDSKKDHALICVQTGLQYVKLYAPAVAIAGASIACILTSYNILNKRNAALAAAYAAVDEGFKKYRERVIERFGETVDKELKYGMKTEQIETTEVDENGKSRKNVKVISAADKALGGSPYAMWFDATTSHLFEDSDYDKYLLRSQQTYATDKLRAGHTITLNDIFDSIGVERTAMGQKVGWVPGAKGCDDFVDFGYEVIPVFNEETGEYEDKIKLDFNVMGYILDLMP